MYDGTGGRFAKATGQTGVRLRGTLTHTPSCWGVPGPALSALIGLCGRRYRDSAGE
jgi:hypothetical protein